MWTFLLAYGGTILIAALLLMVVIGIMVHLYRTRKRGGPSCGCDCGHCPSAGMCHKK